MIPAIPVLLALTAQPLELSWQADGEQCPGPEWLRRRVEILVGPAFNDGRATPIEARAKVRARAGRWRLALTLRAPDGDPSQRRVDGETCDTVAEAAAVVIALAMGADPLGIRERSQSEVDLPGGYGPSGWEMPEPQSTRTAAPIELAAPEEPVPQDAKLAAAFGVGAGLDVGSVGDVGGVITGSFTIERDWLTGAAGVVAALARPAGGDRAAWTWLLGGFARGCVATRFGESFVGPCAVAEIGWQAGRALGVTDPEVSGTWWAAAGGGLTTRLAVGSLALRLDATALAPFNRSRYTVEQWDGEELTSVAYHRAPVVVGRLTVGLEWPFW